MPRGERIAIWLGLAACACAPAPEPPARLNVVWVTIDALRADALGLHGYSRDTSPFLDALARESLVFNRAISQESYTQASVPSYFTSVYPRQHKVLYDNPQSDVLAPRFLTLAEILSAEGYATAAFVFNPHLNERFGFGQGFDLYDDNKQGWPKEGPLYMRKETAQKIHDKLGRYLAQDERRPLFLYLHYRDVHGPYSPPPPYHESFVPPGVEPEPNLIYSRKGTLDRRRDNALFRSQYDGEIRYTDTMLERTLGLLESHGIGRDDTLLVITADHGEEFFEPHPDDTGGHSHGRTLYMEQVHVPLLFRIPGVAPRRIEPFVELVDVMPTILDALGIDPAGFGHFQGRSLLPLARGEAAPRDAVYAGGNHGRAMLIADGWKLIRWNRYVRDDRMSAFRREEEDRGVFLEELYELGADPRERRNLAAERPEVLERMRRLLAEREAAIPEGEGAEPVELDPETRDRLEALGYL